MQKIKMTSRQTQAMKTKSKIYRTAFDLMEKKGYDNITIEEISKKAGVSVGAFYHYFKSKNDILYEIFHRADDYFRENEAQIKMVPGASGRIAEFFKYYARYSILTGLEFTKHLYNTEIKFFTVKDRYMLDLLRNIIEEGRQSGEIDRVMSTDELCDFLFITARGIVFDWCLYDGNYDLEAKTSAIFNRMAAVFAAGDLKEREAGGSL